MGNKWVNNGVRRKRNSRKLKKNLRKMLKKKVKSLSLKIKLGNKSVRIWLINLIYIKKTQIRVITSTSMRLRI